MELKEKVLKLKQYRHLRREAEQLARRARGMEASGNGEGAAGLRALRERCLEQARALADFIEGIDDSLTRQVLACRYLDGHTWKGVAASIGERDEQYPRRIHNRFLEGVELPEALAGSGRERPDAPREKGKLDVVLAGHPLELCYTINGLCDLEERAGMPLCQLMSRQFMATRLLLWAGLRLCQPELSLWDVGELIGECLDAGFSLEDLVEICADGLRAAGLIDEAE